jgi:hypothetical protein
MYEGLLHGYGNASSAPQPVGTEIGGRNDDACAKTLLRFARGFAMQHSMRSWFRTAALLALSGLAFAPARAAAGFDYIASPGSMSGDQPVSAEATFSFSSGQITITLANLQTNTRSSSQAISGISFTISNPSSTTLTLVNVAGDLINPNAPNALTDLGNTTYIGGTLSNSHWGVSGLGITALTGGKPNHMIIGPDNGTGMYPNGNNGLDNFDPYFRTTGSGGVTFLLHATDVTSNTQITGVTFFFGTGPDNGPHGTNGVSPNPAPPSVVLLGLGGICLAGYAVRARRRQIATA